MKALKFIIHSNILIASAAVALSLASQVQLGLRPQAHYNLTVIFFATLLYYNFHQIMAIRSKPEAIAKDKYKWAFENVMLLQIVMALSFTGLVSSLLFAGIKILFLLAPLALLSALYSIPHSIKLETRLRLLGIPGMKTALIAFVWTVATVFVPVFQSEYSIKSVNLLFLFAERFTFICAIAIPFDIRDMKADTLSSRRTIPIELGENKAIIISNTALLLSLFIALIHYMGSNQVFILPAYAFSIISTFIFINNKVLKGLPFYHHGILDGSLVLQGMLIFLSFYLQA